LNCLGNVDWTSWLLEIGSVSTEQLEDAVRLAGLRSMLLPDALHSLGYVEPKDITRAFAAQFGSPPIDFYGTPIPEEVIRAIPDLVVRDLVVLPVAVIGSVLWYATPHVADPDHRERLCSILNRDVRPLWATHDWVVQAERDYYAACHVTAAQSGWWFARYSDDQWLLQPGNRFQEYSESSRTSRST
jgi:hypothetical protein